MAHGFLRRLFEVFERFKTAVDVVTTSEVSVSVTVDDTRRLDDIVDSLRVFAEVACEPKMAIVSVVGERLHEDPALFGARDRGARQRFRCGSCRRPRRGGTSRSCCATPTSTEAMTRLHDAFF